MLWQLLPSRVPWWFRSASRLISSTGAASIRRFAFPGADGSRHPTRSSSRLEGD